MTQSETHEVTSANAANDALLLAGRILVAAIFILAGFNKLTDPAGTIGYIGSVGLPLPEVLYAGTVALELIGGLALAAGFKTRLVALAIAVFTLATALIFHFDLGDQNQFIQFFKNLAIAGGLFHVATIGGGKYSLDRK